MYPDMYGFSGMGDMGASAAATFVIIYAIFMLLMSGYSILVYILHSLGLYTVANRRGIHHPWLAWIPVGNAWILGSISDQYQYVAKGQVKNRRKVLLGIEIAVLALAIVVMVMSVAMIVGAALEMSGSFSGDSILPLAMVMLLISLIMMVLAVIDMVFFFVCYYDLFASCNPNNAVAFLVLSIFFTFLLPFFVFAVRKKDLGMPPRKPQPQVATYQIPAAQIIQPPVQPVQEPAPELENPIDTEE